MILRYSLVSKRAKDGEIVHDYRGRVNENANVSESHMHKFDDSSYQARKIEEMHEKQMDLNPEIIRLETKVVEKHETSFLPRLLSIFSK